MRNNDKDYLINHFKDNIKIFKITLLISVYYKLFLINLSIEELKFKKLISVQFLILELFKTSKTNFLQRSVPAENEPKSDFTSFLRKT